MKRRTALKNLALALGGTIALPARANGWTMQALPFSNFEVTDKQKMLLAEIVETIIPATDTPGAKKLGVDQFVLAMVSDCCEKNVQSDFIRGLNKVDEMALAQFGNVFVNCTPAQRLHILTQLLENKEKNAFLPFVKSLTIQGYLNSEYVMTNLLKYELVPARFNGSFPVKSLTTQTK